MDQTYWAQAFVVSLITSWGILGFAGTVETHVNDAGRNVLRGYRGALYMGIGLAGIGLIVSICFMLMSWRRYHAEQQR
ncbi:hypothetical protein N7532_012115 [Penicillium argentinense]|uniref:Uncharacterized protein n=1 Tax=Penicillium argentinense TaxID=1131581 RepID=A0A9W9JVW6_9EURO|nr:uncharacterized protein N7532_012115 [Penicillium argentinense]KAJ5083072.1 hypothetical protein N7532_012115 [Penicillium argentinense]